MPNIQKEIKMIFVKKLNIFVIMYLDNILFYTYDDRDSQVAAI